MASEKPTAGPVVIVFHHTNVGDLLFSLPLLAGVRAGWSGARVTSAACAYLLALVRGTGLVDEVLERPTRTWPKLRLARRLARRRFDIAVCLAMSGETSLLARLTGAGRRIGFSGTQWPSLLTERVPFSPPPSLGNALAMLEYLGLPVVAHDYVGLVPKDQSAAVRAQELLRGLGVEGAYLAVAPGAGPRRRHKAWAPESFGLAAKTVADARGWRVVVVGSHSEREMAQAVLNACPSAVNLVGRTDLVTLAEVLRAAGFFLGNDSGPMHLAAAVETPLLGIFGPTDAAKTGPCGRYSRVVMAPAGDLSALRPEAVSEAALALFAEAGRR